MRYRTGMFATDVHKKGSVGSVALKMFGVQDVMSITLLLSLLALQCRSLYCGNAASATDLLHLNRPIRGRSQAATMNDSVFNDTASDAAIAALAMGGNDPYLQYQPAFAYTLPIQILVSGITLTLLVMLLIHLLCEYSRLAPFPHPSHTKYQSQLSITTP